MSSSQRVLFLDSLFVIQSCFLSTMPPFSCGYFLRDFHDFLHSHTRSCLSQQPLSHRSALTTSWDVATRPLSVFSLRRRFRRCYFKALAYTAAQIVTSPLTPPGTIHCCWLAVSSLTIRPDLRATHCPVRAIVDSQHRHASSGRHTRQRHMPVDRQQRHPVHYLRRLFSPDSTERRITSKDSEHHHRVEHHFTPPTRHPAPHHRLLVSALFTASLAPSTSTFYASLHQPR